MATGGIDKHPGTGGLVDISFAVAPQDLSSDPLIAGAPRTGRNGLSVPMLGGIPLIAKLGQGGMGAVYYGLHPRLETEVAVKILPFHLAQQQPELIDRFYREAKIAARVKSPHLVSVTDVNQEAGLFYLVMEYVNGKSAGSYLRALRPTGANGLPEDDALDICIAATTGLVAAHQHGVIHRDIKPDNIMIPKFAGNDRLDFSAAKLSDLGLARGEDLGQSLTGSGACLGTPGYLPPEQVVDAKAVRKTGDVFSMGATLYALLTGNAPFSGSALFQVLAATKSEPHRPVREIRPNVSPATAALVDVCLAKDPAQRYADAQALLTALSACRAVLGKIGALPPAAGAVPAPAPAPPPSSAWAPPSPLPARPASSLPPLPASLTARPASSLPPLPPAMPVHRASLLPPLPASLPPLPASLTARPSSSVPARPSSSPKPSSAPPFLVSTAGTVVVPLKPHASMALASSVRSYSEPAPGRKIPRFHIVALSVLLGVAGVSYYVSQHRTPRSNGPPIFDPPDEYRPVANPSLDFKIEGMNCKFGNGIIESGAFKQFTVNGTEIEADTKFAHGGEIASKRFGKFKVVSTDGSDYEIWLTPVQERQVVEYLDSRALTGAVPGETVGAGQTTGSATSVSLQWKGGAVNQTVALNWTHDPRAEKAHPSTQQILDITGKIVGEVSLIPTDPKAVDSNGTKTDADFYRTVTLCFKKGREDTVICIFREGCAAGQTNYGTAAGLYFAGKITEVKRFTGGWRESPNTIQTMTIQVVAGTSPKIIPTEEELRKKQEVNQLFMMCWAIDPKIEKPYPSSTQIKNGSGDVLGEICLRAGYVNDGGYTEPSRQVKFVYVDNKLKTETELAKFRVDDPPGHTRGGKLDTLDITGRVLEVNKAKSGTVETISIEVAACNVPGREPLAHPMPKPRPVNLTPTPPPVQPVTVPEKRMPVDQKFSLTFLRDEKLKPQRFPTSAQLIDSTGAVLGDVRLECTIQTDGPLTFTNMQNTKVTICTFKTDDIVGQKRIGKADGISFTAEVKEIVRGNFVGPNFSILTIDITAKR